MSFCTDFDQFLSILTLRICKNMTEFDNFRFDNMVFCMIWSYILYFVFDNMTI